MVSPNKNFIVEIFFPSGKKIFIKGADGVQNVYYDSEYWEVTISFKDGSDWVSIGTPFLIKNLPD